MAEWLEHWTCSRGSPGSSPALTVSWVYFWQSLDVQLLSQACKFLTGLLLASWDSTFYAFFSNFLFLSLIVGHIFRLCNYQKIILCYPLKVIKF